MKELEGYLDITPGDFKLLYGIAFHHAVLRLTQKVKAGDIMTKEVIFVYKDTPLSEIAQPLADKKISGLPVVDPERRVIGVISEKDGKISITVFRAIAGRKFGETSTPPSCPYPIRNTLPKIIPDKIKTNSRIVGDKRRFFLTNPTSCHKN